MPLDACRVVLVETHYAGNLGATARVMANLGLRHLTLVRPVADPTDRQARQMATHGEPLLDAARVVTELGDALTDCVLVVGTSARTGGLTRRQTVLLPDEAASLMAAELRQGRPTALVFGSEPAGLDNAAVTRCHHLVRIPTAPEFAALNLAQAVAICLYELRKAWDRDSPAAPADPRLAVADHAMQEHLFQRLQAALEAIHFLYGPKADSLMHALRHLLGRARPSVMEAKLLLGLARQIRWYVERHPPDDASRGAAGPG